MSEETTPMPPKKKRKTKKKRAAPKTKHQSITSAHQAEIAQQVIGPKVMHVLQMAGFTCNYRELTDRYNEMYGTDLSTSTLRRYLDHLGWRYEMVPTWTGMAETLEAVSVAMTPHDTRAILQQEDPDEGVVGGDPGHTVGATPPGGAQMPGPSQLEQQVLGR